MLFSSLIFVICFLPVVVLLYYTVLKKSRAAQNIFLFIASMGFYAWGEPRFVLLLALSIFANWLFGLTIDKFRNNKIQSKALVVLMLIFNISLIYYFKYLNFTLENANRLFHTDFNLTRIALPIGISFFTFQAISYVLDVYKEKVSVQNNILNFGLYLSFFPKLVQGPIVRYETIADQIVNRKETFQGFSEGVSRFMVGFGKKVLLANNFALVADKAFGMPGDDLSVAFAWLGAIAYTLQIYFDFSGYSDMAIGLGKMFGFTFLENFNYPYISKSISEFWRRWHISLQTWFRDYVYFPLGGSRVKNNGRLIFNLLVVWALTGLWHGANWTFICWGLLYFVLLTFEKLTGFEKKFLAGTKHQWIASFIKRFYTMIWVIFGWVLFRAESIGHAAAYLKSMLFLNYSQVIDGNAVVYLMENKYFFILGLIFSTPVAGIIAAKLEEIKITAPGKGIWVVSIIVYPLILMAVFFISMSYLIKGSYNPFIYFNF